MRLCHTQGENHTVLLVIFCYRTSCDNVNYIGSFQAVHYCYILAAGLFNAVLFLFQSKRLVKTSPERPQSSIESVWSKLQRFVIINIVLTVILTAITVVLVLLCFKIGKFGVMIKQPFCAGKPDQSERSLKMQVSEHKKAVLMFDRTCNSKLVSHVHECHHQMDF